MSWRKTVKKRNPGGNVARAIVCVWAFLCTLAIADEGPPEGEGDAPSEALAPAADESEAKDVEFAQKTGVQLRSIAESPPEQGAVRMDQLDLGQPVEQEAEERPFLNDATFGFQLRTYYFYRDKYDPTESEAWALGGSFYAKSGYLADRFALGAVLYTSQPLYGPSDRDGTNLLQPGQDGYTVLGQIYGEVKIMDHLIGNFGRKVYNTPFLNAHDGRMTPKTFQGITLSGIKEGNAPDSFWRYGGGYIYRMKDWTDTDFDYLSDYLGVESNRGFFTGGGSYTTENWSVGAIDYFMADVYNIFYSEGSYGWKLSDTASLKLSGQLVDQRSTGDDLLTGSSFDVQQFGVKTDVGFHDAIFTVAYTNTTGGGTDIINEFGGYPGYTSVQYGDFNRSGENAVMGKVFYNFSNLGAKGFSAYALYVHGFNRDVPGTFNEDELDLNVQWTASEESKIKGLSARVRYAQISQDGGGDPTIDDFRVIVNYNFRIK